MGLYQNADVRDNCGFGLIAQMKGIASHESMLESIWLAAALAQGNGLAGS